MNTSSRSLIFKLIFQNLLLKSFRGAPVVVDSEPQWRDILYAAYRADGTKVTAVLFTTDRDLPKMTFPHLKVLVVKNTEAPGAETTKRWYEVVQDELANKPLLLMDNLGGHHHKQYLEEIADDGISYAFFCDQGGKYLNPCDNSIFHTLHQAYLKEDRSTHVKMIQAISKACDSVSATTIKNCFHHTGITSTTPISRAVQYTSTQGFYAHGLHKKEINHLIGAYTGWKKGLRIHNPGEPPARSDLNSLPTCLDGMYWNDKNQI